MSKELTYEDLKKLPSGTKVFVIYNLAKWSLDPKDLLSEYHTIVRVPNYGCLKASSRISDEKSLTEYIKNEEEELYLIDLVDSHYSLIGFVEQTLKEDLIYVYETEPNGEDLL